jgi:hypothetical protein
VRTGRERRRLSTAYVGRPYSTTLGSTQTVALVIRGSTPCALCEAILKDGDDIIGTSGRPLQPDHPLWRYQDAGMHRACFENWPLRDSFRRAFNEYDGPWFMREDGSLEERGRAV